jgi:hypothetical protein
MANVLYTNLSERLGRDKRSSLLVRNASDEERKFYNVDARPVVRVVTGATGNRFHSVVSPTPIRCQELNFSSSLTVA